MLWGRDRFDAAAKRAFEIRLLVAGGSAVQARSYFPRIKLCNSDCKPVSEADGR